MIIEEKKYGGGGSGGKPSFLYGVMVVEAPGFKQMLVMDMAYIGV